MKKTTELILLSVNTLLCIGMIFCSVFLMNGWSVFVNVIFYVGESVLLIAGIVTVFIKQQGFFKSVFILSICLSIFLVAFILVSKIGDFQNYPTDQLKIERLVELIQSAGGWGMAIYVFIQILQVVILPLPALVCYVPGSMVFGPLNATLLASIGVIAGSMISYVIGRFFGNKAVVWIAGQENVDKYGGFLAKRGKPVFLVMQILPFFPDDILCMLAGMTKMNFAYFSAVIVFVRPLIIAFYCFVGGGTVIPYSGWGLAVWAAIFVVCIAFIVLCFKYQDRVEKWLIGKFRKGKVDTPNGEIQVEREIIPETQTAEYMPSTDNITGSIEILSDNSDDKNLKSTDNLIGENESEKVD